MKKSLTKLAPTIPLELRAKTHVATHSMTTSWVLNTISAMNGATDEDVKQRLKRLRQGGYLASADLFDRKKYYHLTQAGAKLMGEPVMKEMHLNKDAKIRAYAGLMFCNDPQTRSRKLSSTEFREKFRQLWKPGMRMDYYASGIEPGRARLGYYKIDYNPGSRKWSYIIPSLEKFVSARCTAKKGKNKEVAEQWRNCVMKGDLEITFVTAMQEKADALEEIYEAKNNMPEHVTVRFYVIEDLLALIAPLPTR